MDLLRLLSLTLLALSTSCYVTLNDKSQVSPGSKDDKKKILADMSFKSPLADDRTLLVYNIDALSGWFFEDQVQLHQ